MPTEGMRSQSGMSWEQERALFLERNVVSNPLIAILKPTAIRMIKEESRHNVLRFFFYLSVSFFTHLEI